MERINIPHSLSKCYSCKHLKAHDCEQGNISAKCLNKKAVVVSYPFTHALPEYKFPETFHPTFILACDGFENKTALKKT